MDYAFIGIIIAVILLILAVLSLVIFGLRNLTYGKHDLVSILLGVLPLVILLILGITGMPWSEAAVMAAVIAFVLAVGALAFSTLRTVFGF